MVPISFPYWTRDGNWEKFPEEPVEIFDFREEQEWSLYQDFCMLDSPPATVMSKLMTLIKERSKRKPIANAYSKL